MTAAAVPPLAPDIAAGLRRLKLSTIRQLAPELGLRGARRGRRVRTTIADPGAASPLTW